jgi:hypothetical protein
MKILLPITRPDNNHKKRETIMRHTRGKALLILLPGLLVVSVVPAMAQKWKIKDPIKSAERTMESVTEGDTKKSKEIVSHTIGYAIDHYKLKDIISKADIDRAHGDLYDFLKWEMGSPTAIAGLYTTAGYEHFERRFGDEAAASLMGVDHPGENGKPDIVLPKTVATLFKALVDSLGAQAAAQLQQQYGLPPAVSREVVGMLTGAGKQAIDHLGFNMPKSWDIDNRLVDAMIYVRRHPQTTKPATAASASPGKTTAGGTAPKNVGVLGRTTPGATGPTNVGASGKAAPSKSVPSVKITPTGAKR